MEKPTIDDVYKEIKNLRSDFVTRAEFESLKETVEILSNPDTMSQVQQSEKDIKSGRGKEISSASDL